MHDSLEGSDSLQRLQSKIQDETTFIYSTRIICKVQPQSSVHVASSASYLYTKTVISIKFLNDFHAKSAISHDTIQLISRSNGRGRTQCNETREFTELTIARGDLVF